MTQDELAQKMGYKSRSTINKIEMNKHDISQSKLVKLSAILEVEPTYFIDDIQHDDRQGEIMKYAKILSELEPDMLDNVMQYIDFISKRP
jgi:transcriptional regulator with XRE-family HTH domain